MSAKNASAPSRARVVTSQAVACLALDLLLVDLGMSVSFATMVVPEVLGARSGLALTELQASWFGSMAFLCQPLGSIFSGAILDSIGRKRALLVVNIPHIAAWILMYLAWDVPTLFLANALLGIGTGIMEAPSITYVGEICDPRVRGPLTTLTNGFTSAGVFLSYLLGAVLPWRRAALASLAVPLASMLLVLLVPETPIWLISKGRQKDAMQALCQVRGWSEPAHVEDEFNRLVQDHTTETDRRSPPQHKDNVAKRLCRKLQLLLEKETRRPLILVLGYFFFHTMSGVLPIRPNMVNFCRAFGMKFDSKAIVVCVGVLFIVMNIVSAVTVKLVGKRKLILVSMVGTSLSSLSLSIYAGVKLSPQVFSYESWTFPEEREVVPLVLFMCLVAFTGLGIPWILLSEVFPFRSRGLAASVSAAITYFFTFVASKSNYNLEKTFHLSGAFAVYSAFGLLGSVFLYFYLPETENKSLTEIQQYYSGDSRIFADDFLINAFRKKATDSHSHEPVCHS